MDTDPMEALGRARIAPAELDAVVGRALGRTVRVTEWRVDPLPVNAITTEAVLHLHGTASCPAAVLPWDLLVKVFRAPRHWPMLGSVPAAHRQTFIDSYPWRSEVDLRSAGAAELMPDGLRLPTLFRSDELGDDRIALWTEWIDAAPGGWDTERYRRAAELLGRLTVRWRKLPGSTAQRAGPSQTRQIVEGPVAQYLVARATDPALAQHPLLVDADIGRLNADMVGLADRLPALVDHFETLERAIGHGDACPQNLLVSRADPETLVAIDLSWPHPEAIGYDLGQLLVGRAHTGELPVAAMPALRAEIIDGFVDGLRQEGCRVSTADVAFAFDASLVVRSAFLSFPLDQLDQPATPELLDAVTRRLELIRYLVDLGLAIRC